MKKIIEFLGLERSNFTIKSNMQAIAICLVFLTVGAGNILTAIGLLSAGLTIAHFSGLFKKYDE